MPLTDRRETEVSMRGQVQDQDVTVRASSTVVAKRALRAERAG